MHTVTTENQKSRTRATLQGPSICFRGVIFRRSSEEIRRSMAEASESGFNKATILIAEDSPTQAEKLHHYLSARGHGVIVTRNGKQALAAALESKPAMVITDVVMPEMDGYTLCKQIKSSPSLKD